MILAVLVGLVVLVLLHFAFGVGVLASVISAVFVGVIFALILARRVF